ncbi:DUF6686 family protein [Ferruginibacter sp.]
MCNYQTWFHDDTVGYVVECNQCNKIQTGFGNLMITFTTEDFENFRNYLLTAVEHRQPSADRKIKSIVIRTPSEGISFLLSEDELAGLQQMIEYADTEMKAAGLLKLFNV